MIAVRPATRPEVGDTCLSVQQPYAHLIVCGLKPVENRSRRTAFRGRLWIHASKAISCSTWDQAIPGLNLPGPPLRPDEVITLTDSGIVLPSIRTIDRGAVIGSVEVYDCLHFDDLADDFDDGDFANPGGFCYLLRDPQPLLRPIPASGALGLWKWRG